MHKSIFLPFLLITMQAFSQETVTSLDQIAYPSDNPDWIRFRPDVALTSEALSTQYKTLFGLSEADELRLLRRDADRIGMNHSVYIQFHQGYRAEGCEWIVHERDGMPVSANGKLMRGTKAAPLTSLGESQALAAAIQYLPHGTQPLWTLTSDDTKRLIPGLSEPEDYIPEGELLWAKASADNDFDADQYLMAWRFEIFTNAIHLDRVIYVDAIQGTLIRSVYPHPSCGLNNASCKEHLHTEIFEGRSNTLPCNVDAQTTWYGTKGIGTLLFSGEYHLVDVCGDADVITVDATASDIVSQVGNDWTNPSDSIMSHVTAHWAAHRAWAYYDEVHDRNSFDDDGTTIYVVNDWDASNASWGAFMVNMIQAIGLGNAMNADPDDDFGTLDIVGHELTHGVVEETADLVYELEPGALNESFADILGTASEWHTGGVTHDWLIGGERDATPVRSMSNPNAYNDPDTYEGAFWVNQSGCTPGMGNDQCGVHTNSGVMNYWFYLLTQGGSGTNDNGDAYTVSGIGIDDAEQIAYRNLTVYLTSMSQFADAREGSIQAAIDLFGCNSPEVEAVINAWYAVGVGTEPVFDLTVTSFDETHYEAISSIDVQATIWNVTSTVMEAGYEITFLPSTDVLNDTDAVILEDCSEIIPLQGVIMHLEALSGEAKEAIVKEK